jgi:hypothetical protein
MARVKFRGFTFDKRTADMLKEAEKLSKTTFRITQGSYSRGRLSAGTHSGGGAVDISPRGMSRAQIERVVKALRTVGFAAWYRTTNEGPWANHIHGVAIGCKDSAPVAKRQVISYKNGKSGLRSNRKDRHAYMRVPFRTWEQYLKTKKPVRGKSWTTASAPARVRLGQRITITGKTSPVAGTIYLQRWVGGKWVPFRTLKARTNGRFTYVTDPTRRRAQYVYRVVKAPTKTRSGSVSATIRVKSV